MKKTIILLLLALTLMLGVSCTTIENVEGTNRDGSPIWTTEIPYSNKFFYGVGSARFNQEKNSKTAADTDAKADLAANIETTIEAFTAITTTENGGVYNTFERKVMESQSITLRSIKIEDRWVSPDGTVWTLCSLPAKDVALNLELDANDYRNKLAKDIIALGYERDKVLKDLERITPSLESAKPKLEKGKDLEPEEKASLDELQKIIDAVEYDGTRPLEDAVSDTYDSLIREVQNDHDDINSGDLKKRMQQVLRMRGYDID